MNSRGPASRRLGSRPLAHRPWPDLPIVAFGLLFVLAILGGGSSRADVPSLLYLRPASVILAGIVLVTRLGTIDWRPARLPGLFLFLLASTIAIQLVALPPSLWSRLPGHAPFLIAAQVAGIAQPWRPISVAPVLTWNAIAALTPPVAALILGAALGERLGRVVPVAIIGAAVASTLLSLLQLTAIADSLTYLYHVRSIGIPSGVFANRNHHAVFLAAAMPVVGFWAVSPGSTVRSGTARGVIAASLLVMFAVAIGVSGSRMGLVLLVPGLAAAVAIGWPLFIRAPALEWARSKPRTARPMLLAGVAVIAGFVVLLLHGTAAVERLGATAATGGEDQRLAFLPLVLGLVRTYLPFGAGFGTFDPMFRMAEPDTALQLTYFNHAHNDLLELLATGGVPAALVLIACLAVLAQQTWVLAGQRDRDLARRGGLAGMAFIAILLAASITDYPLRTPLLAMTSTLCWMLARQTVRRTAASRLYGVGQVK